MNRAQKMAWFFVIVISSSLILSGTVITVLYLKVGMPRALAGLAFMGISGFAGLAPLIFRKDKGTVQCDERDILINRIAALAGFGLAYLVVGLTCMIPFFALGPNATISVVWLPAIFGAAGITTFLVHSVAILIQYGRGGKEK